MFSEMQILCLFLRFVISRSENVFGENLKKHYFYHIKHCQIHNFEARTTRFCTEVMLHVPILPIKFQRSSSTESVVTNVLKKIYQFSKKSITTFIFDFDNLLTPENALYPCPKIRDVTSSSYELGQPSWTRFLWV